MSKLKQLKIKKTDSYTARVPNHLNFKKVSKYQITNPSTLAGFEFEYFIEGSTASRYRVLSKVHLATGSVIDCSTGYTFDHLEDAKAHLIKLHDEKLATHVYKHEKDDAHALSLHKDDEALSESIIRV